MRILVATLLVAGCSFEHGAMQGEQPDAASGDDGSVLPIDGTVGTQRACMFPDLTHLRLCLEFDDGVFSPMVNDASPGRHHATNNDVDKINRSTGHAGRFFGPSVLTVPETVKLDISQAITMELWLNPLVGGQAVNLLANDGQYSMTLDGYGKIGCSLGGVTVYTSTTIRSNDWTHVACTYDGSLVKIYVDGAATECRYDNDVAIATGGLNGTRIARYFVGGIDDIRVYSRALTTNEICTHAGQSACASTCQSGGPGPG